MAPKSSRKSRSVPTFFELHSQKRHIERLEQILTNVVSYGQADSVILCGPSGCGKSAIVEQALSSFRSDKINWPGFRCIYLHGLSHGDTKSSVEHILLELGADTRKNGSVVGSAAEKLRELCEYLRDISKKTSINGIILIIDNLEQLIAQNNQVLLYNLFDTAQQNKLPICIIAMSSVLEVLEKMEKRVKSRFSQQVLNISSEQFTDFEEFRDALGFIMGKYCTEETGVILSNKDVIRVVKRLFYTKNEWSTITKFCRLLFVVCGKNVLSSDHFQSAGNLFFIDVLVCLVKDLSNLQLAMLLCCFEYISIHPDAEAFNFAMIRGIYTSSKKTRNLKFSDHLLLRAFQDLTDCGLLAPVGRAVDQPVEYEMLALNISRSQLQNAVLMMDMASVPTDIQQWCSSYQ